MVETRGDKHVVINGCGLLNMVTMETNQHYLAWTLVAMLRGCYVTEQHRTQTEFEDTLVMKSFLFQFVNNFAAISYIAYFKGRYSVFLKNFWRTQVLFMGPLISLFLTSGDVCPGMQSQGGSLACFLTWVILRFTSGVTPANCIDVSMAAKPFWSKYLQTCPQALAEVQTAALSHNHLWDMTNRVFPNGIL